MLPKEIKYFMNGVWQSVITGITSFVATNLDDLVILTLFFARVSSTFRGVHIVAGQYLGILTLILASLPGYLFGFWIPKPWLGLLGLVPLAIGIHSLRSRDNDAEAVPEMAEVLPKPTSRRSWRSLLAMVLTPPSYQVAAVTVANGGDNIGIYVPLFANCKFPELSVILVVFLVMTAVWCGVARQFTVFPLIGRQVRDYGHVFVPWILIGLGIWIFLDAESYRLLQP